MSTWPFFSNPRSYIVRKINSREDNPVRVSSLVPWIRVSSAVGDGLILYSNPDYQLFSAAGDANVATLYGSSRSAGIIGFTWSGKPVLPGPGQPYRPSPIISSINVEEGIGESQSRKLNFSIRCHSKGQADEVLKYFLEPGYTVFVEWGWNTPDAVRGWRSNLTPDYVASFQDFETADARRELTNGDYDNYLGFIVGGSISLDGESWNIQVNLVGFTELASFLSNDESGGHSIPTNDDQRNSVKPVVPFFTPEEIEGSISDLGRQRFMRMFNDLPDTRRTFRVRALLDRVAQPENFINFDEDVRSHINKSTESAETIVQNRYIKFSTLMAVINELDIDAMNVSGKSVPFSIHSDNTLCMAFPKIFSTDPSKLLIPNSTHPTFLTNDILSLNDYGSTSVKNNSIGDIKFPLLNNLVVTGTNNTASQRGPLLGVRNELTSGYYGRLDDLYVNFDFAASVMNTKNYLRKDMLFDILNGMSSAVGNIWNFQITEKRNPENNSTRLELIEVNVSNLINVNGSDSGRLYINTLGSKSVLLTSGFELDISGAKSAQIIAQRYRVSANQQGNPVPRGLFSTQVDKVLLEISKAGESPDSDGQQIGLRSNPSSDYFSNPTLEVSRDSRIKSDIIKNRLELVPSPFVNNSDIISIINAGSRVDDEVLRVINYLDSSSTLIAGFKDTDKFNEIKIKSFLPFINKELGENVKSSLLPVKFSFSVHGVSGIRWGNTFYVNGLPQVYDIPGSFFQITNIKHTVDSTKWSTDVEGGWRV